MEKISIIVPVYNVEKYLNRCVESLIKQTYENLEIILVNDGSKDGSGILCEQLMKRYSNIKVIHKPNGGLGSARNAGLDIAEGEYIGFLDSDDWVSSDMYEYLLNLAREYDSDVTQIDYRFISEYTEIKKQNDTYCIRCIVGRDAILETYLKDGMKEKKSYPVTSKLYKAGCFKTIRFPEGQLYEDVVTNFDILSHANKYVISNKPCYYYFINPQSITRSIFSNKDLDYIKVGEQIVDRTKNNEKLKSLGVMTLSRFHFMCLCKMIKYRCEKDVDVRGQVKKSVVAIRKGIPMLLKSSMKLNRKAVMIALCLNIGLTELVAVKIHSITR